MSDPNRAALVAALRWQIEAGAIDAYGETPGLPAKLPEAARMLPASLADLEQTPLLTDLAPPTRSAPVTASPPPRLIAGSAARDEAVRLAAAATTLDDLRAAIAAFEHLGLKHTAKNLVFSDGDPRAPVMLIGEAPGADEDIQGKPFVGVSGQLLDKILASIGRDRHATDSAASVYIANILNWRPPGNRTPTPAEIEVSLPFIERHIDLVAPRLLILAGGVAAKALLHTELGITKLRGRWRDYTTPQGRVIPLLATYHPSFLLRTPTQKRLVWQDMLAIQGKLRSITL